MNRISTDTLSPDEWVGEFARAIAYWGSIIEDGDGLYLVTDHEDDNREYTVTWRGLDDAAKKIVLGETEVAPLIASYIVSDDIDDDAGDCIVQIAALGEIRYG